MFSAVLGRCFGALLLHFRCILGAFLGHVCGSSRDIVRAFLQQFFGAFLIYFCIILVAFLWHF